MRVITVSQIRGFGTRVDGDYLTLAAEDQTGGLTLELPRTETANLLQAVALGLDEAEASRPNAPKPFFGLSGWELGTAGGEPFVSLGLPEGGRLRFQVSTEMLLGMREAISESLAQDISGFAPSGRTH